MYEAEVDALPITPKPLDDLKQALPVASYLMEEKPQPLLLLTLEEKELEAKTVKLPSLAALPD